MTPTCILVHPVGTTCNIACGYCFHRYTDMKDFSRKMLPETFIRFYKQWVNVIPDNKECEIIWHGGEPTLRGIQFYEEVFCECSKYTPATKKVRHCVQTNGVIINEKWANLFSQYGALVGISIDGPRELHNRLRVHSSGKGTFEKAINAYRILSARGVATGIVVVVNKYNVKYPDEVFGFMQEYGIKRLQLSPCMETSEDKDNYSISVKEFESFICRLYDLWVSHDDPEISIGFISDVVNHLLGRPHDNCLLNDYCGNFAVLDWTGDIKTCDGMRTRQKKIGGTENVSIDDSKFHDVWVEYHKNISSARFESCHGCEWYELCYGGCPYHWPEEGILKTAFCESHKRIFSHIANSIKTIYGGH